MLFMTIGWTVLIFGNSLLEQNSKNLIEIKE